MQGQVPKQLQGSGFPETTARVAQRRRLQMWVTPTFPPVWVFCSQNLGISFMELGVSFTTVHLLTEFGCFVHRIGCFVHNVSFRFRCTSECSLHDNALTSAQLLWICLQVRLVDLTNQSSPFVAFGAAQFQLLELGVLFTEMGVLFTNHRRGVLLHEHSSACVKNITITCCLMS